MFAIKLTKKLLCMRINSLTPRTFLAKTISSKAVQSNQNRYVKPVFYNALKYSNKIAIHDHTGNYTFHDIYVEAQKFSIKLSEKLKWKTGERVLFLCPNDASYVITIWAIWMSGQIAVPLSPSHPEALMKYYISDTSSSLLISAPQFLEKMDDLAKQTGIELYALPNTLLENLPKNKGINGSFVDNNPVEFYQKNDAMILYTSGTTGKPKGVVLTHKNIYNQMKILTEAWKWTNTDVILHTLPLHHVHGTINALFCPLFIGATTIMMPKFNSRDAWSYLLNQNDATGKIVSVFMGVPTMYAKLIEEFENNLKENEINVKNFMCNNVRLMISGSAPLHTPLYQKWLNISGHKLLERYGMTEIGMCLSNSYNSDREPGYVGMPLPSVSIALTDQDTGHILFQCSNIDDQITVDYLQKITSDITGELLVKGDSVFREYYNKPNETKKEFTQDGWFKTGDICQYDSRKNKMKILGRKSADIIKSGGYKISALEIETLLLEHPNIKECTILGVTDEVYGERIAALIVLNDKRHICSDELKSWAMNRMPKYWVPSVLKLVDEIPKNAMGKINKQELVRKLFK